MPKSVMAWTSWPAVTAPLDTRQAPTASTAIVPRLVSVSRAGSKVARSASTCRPHVAQPAGGLAHAGDLAPLEAQGLDHQRPVERLVGQGGHLAGPVLHVGGRGLDAGGVDPAHHAERGEQGQAHEGEQRVDDGQAHDRRRQQDDDAEGEG